MVGGSNIPDYMALDAGFREILPPLVGKLVKYFRNVVVKHISVFHQRWGNGGSFEGFAAD